MTEDSSKTIAPSEIVKKSLLWWEKFPLWTKFLAVAILVFLASIGYFHPQLTQNEQEVAPESSELDQGLAAERVPAPDIQFLNSAGAKTSLSTLKGKVVIVTYWATWCNPCLVELPTFRTVHEKLAERGLVVVPINVDEPNTQREFINNFWSAEKLPFETFFDPEKTSANQFRVETLPSSFVIDRKGRIAMNSSGANDWSNEKTLQTLDELLAEPAP